MFINSILFKENFHPFKIMDRFSFNRHINVITGDNGSGKSTLIKCLVEDFHFCNKVFYKDKEESIFFFDSEKHNPRNTPEVFLDTFTDFIKENETDNKFIEKILYYKHFYLNNISVKVDSYSHGEIIYPMLSECFSLKDSIIFLDEPETSLSKNKINELILNIEVMKNNGNQMFISTHNDSIINHFGTNIELMN